MWSVITLIGVLLLGNVVFRSILILGPSDMIVTTWLGSTFRRTYITEDYRQDPSVRRWFDRHPALAPFVSNAWGNMFVFLPWPLVVGFRISTNPGQVDFKASETFTLDASGGGANKGSARVQLDVDSTFNYRLSPMPWQMIRNLGLLSWPNVWFKTNLTEVCPLPGNHGVYNDTIVTKELRLLTMSQVLSSIRQAAAKFSWRGGNDIIERQDEFERALCLHLAVPNGFMVELGVFSPVNVVDEYHRGYLLDQIKDVRNLEQRFYGASVAQFDFTIEQITHQDKPGAAGEADLLRYKAQEEAFAKVLTREAEGKGRQAEAVASGISPEELYQGEVIKQIDNATVFASEAGLLQAFANLFSPKKPGRGGRGTP